MTYKKENIPWNKGLTKEADERIRRIAEFKIGKRHSKETIKKMSEAMKGKKHPFYGKTFSKQHRFRISKGKMKKNPKNFSELFTDDHKQILLGSILGDASLSHGGGINYYLEEIHSVQQRDYLSWKDSYFKILGSKTKDKIHTIRKLNKSYKQFRLKTLSFPILTKCYEEFYFDGKKTITKNILDQLNELGLTVWYLDDGHATVLESLIRLSTDNYSYQEHLLIKKWFRKTWNLGPRIGKRTGKYYLLFNKKDSKTLLLIFKNVFEKYRIPGCMCYKLGYLCPKNEEKVKIARKKKNEYKRNWRRKKSEPIRKRKLMETKKKIDQIQRLYWDDGLSSSQIAEKLGYKSYTAILKIMKKHNIPRRTLSESTTGERNPFYGRHHSKESIEKMLKTRNLRRIKNENFSFKPTIYT
ncbi:MAG: hypothetical protein ISS48_02275 [Candidatus Aenigmarchaeota archaeon]|nr:hypothetical protein [Candidatus Aenigmarchaeota archaeon]